MKIGDFGMSRHVALAKRPDGSTSLVRQMTTGNDHAKQEDASHFVDRACAAQFEIQKAILFWPCVNRKAKATVCLQCCLFHFLERTC